MHATANATVTSKGLQHTTKIWNSSSCTNKHDKLMDTSIQVLSITKYLALCTDIPDLISHSTKNETAKIT